MSRSAHVQVHMKHSKKKNRGCLKHTNNNDASYVYIMPFLVYPSAKTLFSF